MKLCKKMFAPVLILLIVVSTVTSAGAAEPGEAGKIMTVSTENGYFYGIYSRGVTFVPLYIFADTFGGSIYGWSFEYGVAYVYADNFYLTAYPGDIYINANDRFFYTGQPVMDVGGTVYVPVEPMAKAFGLDVEYVSDSEINLWGSGRNYCAHAKNVYVEDELYWLSRIIYAEAGCEPLEGQMAVGNVVMNRVAHPEYPDNIYGVIFDHRYGVYQFTPAATGTVYREPSYASVVAAKMCLEGYSLSEDMLFFLNPRIATNFWIVENCAYIMTIGNHDFYA